MGLEQSSDVQPPESSFDVIVQALQTTGWIVLPDFLDQRDWLPLLQRAQNAENFSKAGIGRGDNLQENLFVRNDSIRWLDGSYPEEHFWLGLMEQLRLAINRRLFLGLFEFESHYARYEPGSFYKRHVDAFKDEGIRIVSAVLYLNPGWQPTDGGEFVIYPDGEPEGLKFLPTAGTLAVFLSEDFPHEVLTSNRTRFSIAGWFRVNTTTGNQLDPPL